MSILMKNPWVTWMPALVLLAAAPAAAQDRLLLGTLTRSQNSVTDVMRSRGCNLDWLSKVLEVSRIDPPRVWRLPVGQRLYFPLPGSCQEAPPADVARRSRQILQTAPGVSRSPVPASELSALRSSTDALKKQVAEVRSENDKLKLQVSTLEEELADVKQADATITIDPAPIPIPVPEPEPAIVPAPIVPAPVQSRLKSFLNRSYSYRELGYTALGALLIGSVLMGMLFALRNRDRLSIRKKITFRDNGRTYTFLLNPYTATYQCPGCSANNLLGHKRKLRSHLREQHPYTRMVVEVDHSFADRSHPV